MRLDPERDARRRDAVGQRLPVGHRQHDAEMRHRHVVAVDRVRRPRPASRRDRDARRSDARTGRNRSTCRCCALRGSRACRRRRRARRRDRGPGKARWNGRRACGADSAAYSIRHPGLVPGSTVPHSARALRHAGCRDKSGMTVRRAPASTIGARYAARMRRRFLLSRSSLGALSALGFAPLEPAGRSR